MKENYQGLSLAVLREQAKARGMKGISALKKDALIERLVQQDEKDQTQNTGKETIRQEEQKEPLQTEKAPAQPRQAEVPAAEKAQPRQAEAPAAEKAQPRQTPEASPRRFQEDRPRREQEDRSLRRSSEDRPRREQEDRTRRSDEDRPRREQEDRPRRGDEDRPRREQEDRPRRGDEDRPRRNEDYRSRREEGSRLEQASRPDQVRERGREYPGNQSRPKTNRVFNASNMSPQNGQARRKVTFRPENAGAAAERPMQRPYPAQDRNYEAEMDHSQPVRETEQLSPFPDDPEQIRQIQEADAQLSAVKEDLSGIDSGNTVTGILEILTEGYGFIRSDNYLPGDSDVYVSPSQIRRFNLKTGDVIGGNTRVKTEKEKFSALLYVTSVNGYHPSEAQRRPAFENLTPIFPNKRLYMERPGGSVAMRVVDLVSPIGKGQRGMIVSQPKAGKTTLLKEIAKSICYNNPDMHLIILLIDERPEEVTDMKEAIQGDNVEVIYSTFDETPEHHRRVSEMVIERAKRLVEHKEDVIILLDSITRLARAYNLTCQPTGRTLSGGLDPGALHMPKRFFGAARNMREGGSLTVLATALVDTGSKMDDVVFEEFKGTGNMELVLDRKLSEKRIFPAIDVVKSGTRREDLLLDAEEQEAVDVMRRAFNSMRSDEAVENILTMFARTGSNKEFIELVRKNRIL